MKRFFVLAIVLILAVSLIAGALFLIIIAPAPFSMRVIPENTMDSIAGQRCVFLVTVADEGQGSGGGEAVDITATAPGAAVTVEPQAITPGQVAEITVIPDKASTGETLIVNIKGERDGLTQTEMSTIVVWVGEDTLEPYATDVRDRFIPWLAANYSELGITTETEWTGTVVRPRILVVTHYLFFSENWEMGVSWHVTIPPHDWTRIYLRHRATEVSPSYAFEISSLDAQEDPHAIDPKDAFAESVWR
ncbi:MAG: hypothetical protein AVW05_00605 [Hadesarchaea archaeon DG-33]|nr:MAG: hypothetical protein AVW05_00605 [Hadesarchaea archaeon DG-33]